MPRLYILTLTCLVATTAHASSDCVEAHILEAMALNEARKPLYADATGGQSLAVSTRLIQSEQAAVFAAKLLDWKAQPFRAAGIPLLCDEMIDMHHTPSMSLRAPTAVPAIGLVDAGALQSELTRAYEDGGFEALYLTADAQLHQLEATPDFGCMVRHMLESVRRAAALAEGHAQRAAHVGLEAAEARALSWRFLQLQIASLPLANELDRAAAPIQADGVPILCNDVPYIPDPRAE